MRVPAAVQPGQEPRNCQYLKGHSKERWCRPGKAVEMVHGQGRPGGGEAMPKLFPQMSWARGFPQKGGVYARAGAGGAWWGGAYGGGGGRVVPPGAKLGAGAGGRC